MWVDHEQHMGKGGPKVGSVNVPVPTTLWRIKVFTARAVEFDGLLVGCVG